MYSFEKSISELFGTLMHTVDAEGNVWFRAPDVYKALGLAKVALARIDAEDKAPEMFPTDGSNRRSTGINEAGLYTMIMASRKPEAKAFKRWVAREVIPSIRKNGGYIEGQEHLATEERAKLEAEIKALHDEVQRINAGKAKLTGYLMQEEERTSKLTAWNAACQTKLNAAEAELLYLRRSFSNLDYAERYVESLRAMRAFDARKKEQQELERRIPYAAQRKPR